jgi:uncharacterized SAM-binding protein YcdF (DUF218 family)
MIDFHFDTRNKKPDLYDLALLSAVFLVLFDALYLYGNRDLICYGLLIYFVLCLNILLDAFFKQLEYNPYSYNTIIYSGFALFVSFLIATFIYLVYISLFKPVIFDFHLIIETLLLSARYYMFITFPFILVFSLALSYSNIILIRKEGLYHYNILGFILSALLVGGQLIVYLYNRSNGYGFYSELLINIFCAVYLYFECMMIGTIIANLIVADHEPDYDKDFIIILGCGIDKKGWPLPLLAGRIDRAIRFYEKQLEETGKKAIFIPSGGKGDNEVVSEAQAMKNYLLSKGYNEEDIIMEDQSVNTYENMLNSKKIIEEKKEDYKVVFSTSGFHVFRAGLKARRVKMRAIGIGQKTIWYFWPNALVREFVGLLSQHRVKQGLVLLGLIVIYMVLTFLSK